MLCKGCGREQARENDPFCSDECADLWAHGRQKRWCKRCGKEFLRYTTRHATICDRCFYIEHYAAPKSPARRENIPAPKDPIGEVIALQRAIYVKTGRRLSYGELIVLKEKGKL